MIRPFLFLTVLFLSACGATDPEKAPLVLKESGFYALPGWEQDDHSKTFGAFARSCERILKNDPEKPFGPEGVGGVYGDWHPACKALIHTDPVHAKAYFEHYFSPYQASAGRLKEGLFTGYYEAALNGSRTRHGPYQYPLHKRPDDLVMVDLGQFRDELKGQRIAGRVLGAHLKPYEDRAEIEKGKLASSDELALIWVDNPVDSFFLHIQGSGRVNLDDGTYVRVGYDGQNGHPYYAIGRELIKRGYMDKDEVSMQSIRTWLEARPREGAEIMNTNKSYVFFRELEDEGPLGGEGVPLTPERSLAVDRTKIPYGAPVWVSLEPPVEKASPVRRLMVAQDTGGAIRGAVRGDVFWGHGPEAEYLAGHMKSEGRYWLFLPKAISGDAKLSLAK